MIHDLSRDVLHITEDNSADRKDNRIPSMSDMKDSAGINMSGQGHGSKVFQRCFLVQQTFVILWPLSMNLMATFSPVSFSLHSCTNPKAPALRSLIFSYFGCPPPRPSARGSLLPFAFMQALVYMYACSESIPGGLMSR